ncbi:MAG: AI-2E family transporter [Bryobacteraceae bacterium]
MALFSASQTYSKLVGIRSSIVASAALVALLYYGRDFFITLIISAVFAFILDPAVLFAMKLRLPRPAATAVILGIALVVCYLITAVAWSQLSRLTEDLPTYASRVSELLDATSNRLDQFQKQTVEMVVPKTLREQGQEIEQKPQQAMQARRRRSKQVEVVVPPSPPPIQEVRIHNDPKPFITTVYTVSSRYFHRLFLLSFVPFLVFFMLSWRDHVSKSVIRLFNGHDRYVVGKSWSGIGDSTRAYVLGNFILWVLLSIASALAFFFLGVPYWPLVGLISAFFSLVPYVGLPLAMLPPVLAAIAIPNRFKIILLVAGVTAGLHFVTMNFLYAKIIGRRVRLNPLVVTIALMFWGLMWGGVGLILAVPITAAVKAVCDNVEALEPYGRLLGD